MVISDGKIQAMEDLIDCLQHIVCRKYHERFVGLMGGAMEGALASTSDPEEKKDIVTAVVEKLSAEIKECADSVIDEHKVLASVSDKYYAEIKRLLSGEIVKRILNDLTIRTYDFCDQLK